MAKLSLVQGTSSKLLDVFIQSASSAGGGGLAGLSYSSASLTAYYYQENASSATAINLVSSTLGTYTSGGFTQISSSNMPGMYQVGIPNAALSSASSVVVMLQGAANMAPLVMEIELTLINNQSTGFGLVNASANAVQINGVSASSVTTINANIGTTQAIAFDTNNFQKVDLVDIAGVTLSTSSAQIGVNLVNVSGSAVSVSSAQLGVNAVNIAGQAAQLDGNNLLKVDVADILGVASQGGAGYVGVDWSKLTNVSSANNLSNTNIATNQVISSVTATVSSNVIQWLGNAVTSASSGLPDVNVKKYNNQTSVTDGNNYPSVNIVDIAGTASAGTAGYVAPDWSHINSPSSTVNLSNTTISIGQTISSVSGAVGSVTGNIGGSVASVTGNVGGNVNGSVSSVIGLTTSSITTAVLTTSMTESYPIKGSSFTLAQGIYDLVQQQAQMSITGTTMTVLKRDQMTQAKTLQLNSATTPTSISEAS
jgi:hypothetical protein